MISAILDGDWGDPTIWSGGLVPTVGDDVDLAGHAVTFDTSAEVNSLTDTATGAGLAVGTGTFIGTLVSSAGTSVLVTVTGTFTYSGVIEASGTSTIIQNNGTLNWTANGTVTAADTSIGINNAGTFNINTTIQLISSDFGTALAGGGIIATSGSQVVITRGSSSDTVPATGDVRLGVHYGPAASLVGTLTAGSSSTLHWNPADPKHWD